MPAGARTAPEVTVPNVNKVITTIHFVDASGDNATDTLITSVAPAVIDVEAWVAAFQAVTQASVWKVSQSTEWIGDEDVTNAQNDQRSSVKDGINMMYTDIANLNTQTPRVVAPISDVMQGDQDIPLLSAGVMVTLIAETIDILVGFSLDSAQYSERRERSNNPRIKT